jgi:hypothetical protein
MVAGRVSAATLRVPADSPTIHAGVDAAVAGDSVLVAAGTWTDFEVRGTRTACVFLKDGVVLRSESGPAVTTIDMMGIGTSQPNVIFGQLLSSGATLVEGFTITGVPFGRSGVFVANSEKVTFQGCVFRDMDGGVGSAGIGARFSDIDVIDCVFRDLIASSGGAGIEQSDASILVDGCTFTNCADRAINLLGLNTGTPESAVIRNSTFIGNSTASAGGGAIAIANYELGGTISGCWFEDNVAVASAGALHIAAAGYGPVTVQDCVFLRNATSSGGAIGGAISTSGQITVQGNTFVGNTSLGGGAAVSWQAGQMQLTNNIITDCVGAAAVRQSIGGSTVPSCNVYGNNAGGNTTGFTMASTSREADPLFCDSAGGDFTLQTASPCLPANSLGCGQIGALDQGCGTVSVQTRTWGAIKAGYR